MKEKKAVPNDRRNGSFHHKKSLGQNFLTDEMLLENLVSLSGVGADDRVLEIGAGAGAMTRVLGERCREVISIEVDGTLLPILRVSLEKYRNVWLIHGDAMRLNLPELTAGWDSFHVVANIPYYLTSDLMNLLMASGMPIRSVNVMVQKEAAERLTARPGSKEYSVLSVKAQYFGRPEIVLDVPRALFTPPPKVDSAFVTMPMRAPEERMFQGAEEALFLKIVSAAFALRRKTLLNNLMNTFHLERSAVEKWLADGQLDASRRGEALSVREFAALTRVAPCTQKTE